MVSSLKGKKLLVTGGSRGLGALICERFAQEGSDVAINYISAEDRAKEVAKTVESHGVKAVVIGGDVGVRADCERMVKEATEALGGLDIIIANAGWTKATPFGDLNALTDEEWDKCWNVNTKSNLHLLRAASATFNANPEGGCFLITSSIAGSLTGGSSMAYSVSKAAGLHLMTCLAETQGPKIRVNAIQPGWLATELLTGGTEWGLALGDDKIAMYKDAARLKQETKLDDCAEAFVMAAKNSSMTGVRLRIDSGLNIRC